MFPTMHDPAIPFCMLATPFDPLIEPYAREAGPWRGRGYGGLPHPDRAREHPISAVKPCGCGSSLHLVQQAGPAHLAKGLVEHPRR